MSSGTHRGANAKCQLTDGNEPRRSMPQVDWVWKDSRLSPSSGEHEAWGAQTGMGRELHGPELVCIPIVQQGVSQLDRTEQFPGVVVKWGWWRHWGAQGVWLFITEHNLEAFHWPKGKSGRRAEVEVGRCRCSGGSNWVVAEAFGLKHTGVLHTSKWVGGIRWRCSRQIWNQFWERCQGSGEGQGLIHVHAGTVERDDRLSDTLLCRSKKRIWDKLDNFLKKIMES